MNRAQNVIASLDPSSRTDAGTLLCSASIITAARCCTALRRCRPTKDAWVEAENGGTDSLRRAAGGMEDERESLSRRASEEERFLAFEDEQADRARDSAVLRSCEFSRKPEETSTKSWQCLGRSVTVPRGKQLTGIELIGIAVTVAGPNSELDSDPLSTSDGEMKKYAWRRKADLFAFDILWGYLWKTKVNNGIRKRRVSSWDHLPPRKTN